MARGSGAGSRSANNCHGATQPAQKQGDPDKFDQVQAKSMLKALANDTDSVSTIGIHAAAQTVFALDVLYRAYASRDPANKKEINAAIGKLFDDVGDPMKPETFTKEQFLKDQQAVAALLK